jgi:hypothetical protein
VDALEASVEKFAVEEAHRRWGRDSAEKWGLNGWPDRQILPGGGRHFWLELKTHSGRLRKAQVIRKRLLEAKGDRVYVPRSRDDIRDIYDLEG